MDFLYATILVLVVTDQRMLLAADSRKTYLEENGIQKIGTIDKIYQTKNCYYAVCGFHEEEGKFSIHQLLHDYLLSFSGLQYAIKEMVNGLAKALKNYFSELKDSSPAIFHQLKKYSSGLKGEAFLVQSIDGFPTAYLLDYFITEGPTIKVTVNWWSVSCKDIKESYRCFYRAVGNTGLLPISIAEDVWALHPESTAKLIIEDGIKKAPDLVAAPVNMLELSAQGVRWIEKSQTSPNGFE